MGMDLQVDTYDHGLIDRHLFAWSFTWTLTWTQIDT